MLLLFIILVLVLSIPAVQTRLGKYATNWLNTEYGTNININRVGLQFNGDVELKEILIRDYKKDTLISAVELNTSILNFKNLANSKLAFGDIDLEGLIFNIIKYKGEEETNLDIFVARFDEDNPRESVNTFLMSSSDISIYDGIFRLIDENKETPKILEFTAININATNFLINGPNVSTRINTLAFKDSRGLIMKNLSSNFAYTLEDITLDNLKLKTTSSSLEGDLKFLYNREHFSDFTNKVNVEANFTDASVALDELNVFYNEFGIGQRANFNANISGTLNDLHVDNLKLNTSSRTRIYGDIDFKNLFNIEENNFSMKGKFANLSSNYKDLKALLPNVLGEAIPSVFDKLGNFSINGTSFITTSTIQADLKIDTDLGYVISNLEMKKIDDIDNATYKGNIIFDEFDIGTFLNDPNLKKASLNLDVDGKGFTQENLNTKVKGDVYSISYNDYVYQNINISGNLKDKVFNGKVDSQDKNFKLKFNGLADFSEEINKFDFVANVDYANLKALNFIKKDSMSVFKGIVDMKMQGTTLDNAVGSIQFNKTYYQNENDEYFFDDFAVNSSFKEKVRYINVNSPDIIEGQMSGVFLIDNIDELFINAIGSLYTKYSPYEVSTNQYIDFNFKIYNKIIEVFVPELQLGKNTFVKGRVESDEKEFTLTFKSPKIEWLDYFANAIELQVDNKNPLFNTYVEVDSLHTDVYNISKFNLINVTINDTLFMRSEFKGGKTNNDLYNLSFYHTKNEANQSIVGFKKSDVTFKGNKWYINEEKNNFNKVTFDTNFENFNIDQFVLNHNDEKIQLSGIMKGNNTKDLQLNFKNVFLDKITPDIESLSLKGIVNGNLDIIQQNGKYLPESSITIDDLEVNELIIGSFAANIKGNQSLTNYTINASIKDDEKKSFSAIGDIDVSSKAPSIDVALLFNQFNLQPLNPFLEGVLKDIRGLATGKVKVTGNLNKPSIDGELELNKGGLGISELNVDYSFADKSSVTLRNQSFIFNSIDITDTVYNTKAVLDGRLNHNNFGDWGMRLNLETDRLLVLNTTEDEDRLYYGTGFVGGSASISGPASQLRINVIGETKKGTVFVIPLNDSESFGDNSHIHFLSPEEKQAKLEGRDIINEDISGLELDFDLDVTQDAEIEIVMDKESGSTIRGRGEGGLLAEINTNGKFNMYGDFSVFEGIYKFRYGGVIQKDFTVVPGGTLGWNGDPLKATIDIEAIYKTQANPSPLLDSPINRRIPVNLGIELTGELEQLDIDYNFQFPNLSSIIISELNYRLESKDDRSNQALYLLATGSFSSSLSELNVNGTIEERINGIINGLLSDGDNKLQVGLNVELGENTPDYQSDDRLGVTLQTNISDRIRINGKVGVPIGGISQTAVAGDVQIDFLLNEEGTFTANVFNRENSIRNFGEEIGYTQGLGIAYNVDFDTFSELIQIIFKGKKKIAKEKEEEEAKQKESNALPDYVGFKKKKDTVN
ncbi:translocation/assembly module TamB domain-containing protein [Oceanihabitans sp. 2_MG-2023]|uniref:translocation/assembly module TamB domain-containing protein n=1 Tax=Oceanihabitans sp. 2_MG-2023 TaxID=3062661 RepID=UPI0026E24202|nr:translocation/assembly module TamB domain-containing protein [Oceanihabitans sp. 2_MG-2023]MDO6596849.1 translocation/assembly module TamB domain-containing protein [Oceanihabitans sp. 2_MG-2023]